MLREDPSLLGADYYAELTNMVCTQEGNLTGRNGSRRLTSGFDPAQGYPHSLARLNANTYALSNPMFTARYIGIGTYIYGSVSGLGYPMGFSLLLGGLTSTGNSVALQRFTNVDFAPNETGSPYKYFATPNLMLKDNGTLNLQNWGLVQPPIPVRATNQSSGPVGPSAFIGAGIPYKWVYTYRNPFTGVESNPCMYMIDGNAVAPNGFEIKLLLRGSFDTQVPTTQGLAIYRAGGNYADGLYRLIGYANNPGPGNDATFYDTLQDSDIASNPILETDNDPPVPSSYPIQVNLVATAWASPDVGTKNQYNTFVVGIASGPPGGDIGGYLTAGSVITCGIGLGVQEECVIATVDGQGGNTITVYLQHQWGTNHFPAALSVSTRVNSPAPISLAAFDSIFLAGDAYNPQVLYKSKTSRPESFPVLEVATGISNAINVGAPSNPINGLIEFNGAVICLNKESLYVVGVFQAAMQAPIKTPAKHGLVVRGACCKTPNEIWYVSYDGIYSWAGGEEVWRSKELDPLFRGIPIGPYLPIDMTPGGLSHGLDIMTMEFNGLEIFIVYTDVNGTFGRLRYHTVFQRWSIDVFSGQAVFSMFSEPDTGNMLLGVIDQNAPMSVNMYLDNIGTTDGWAVVPSDGHAITYAASPVTIDAAPAEDKLFSDFNLECSTSDKPVTIQTFYDFSGVPDPLDVYSIAANLPTRSRYPFSFSASQGRNGYACRLRVSGSYSSLIPIFNTLTVNYWELAQYRDGLAFDWDDLGTPDDKVIRKLNIEMDTGGGPATIQLQGDGVNLGPPLTVTTTHSDRSRLLAFPDGLVARMVRLVITPGLFGYTKYFKHSFDKFDWPGSVTFWESDWTDMDYPHDKDLRNLNLEVDSYGQPATVTLLGDGGTSVGTYTIITDSSDQNRVIALPDDSISKMVKLQVTAAAGAFVRVFRWSIDHWKYPPALTFWESDSTDLKYDHDKNLRNLTLELDTGGKPATVSLWCDNALAWSGVTTTTLHDRNRVYALPDNTIARMLRVLIQPVAPGDYIRVFDWNIDHWQYPPSLTFWECDWSDEGWPYEKVFRALNIDIDTGGLPATVTVQGDGVTVATFSVTSTLLDRSRVLTMPDNVVNKLVRILVTAFSPNGYVRVFSTKFDKQDEPAALYFWDSYQINFGYDGFSFVKQIWLKYNCASAVTFTLFSDQNAQFYQVILPPHINPSRDIERFYLPAATLSLLNQTVLNKSKTHRFTVSGSAPVKIYQEGTRFEWLACGQDQRYDYQQVGLTELTGPK